jgi:hypothetical protein
MVPEKTSRESQPSDPSRTCFHFRLASIFYLKLYREPRDLLPPQDCVMVDASPDSALDWVGSGGEEREDDGGIERWWQKLRSCGLVLMVAVALNGRD